MYSTERENGAATADQGATEKSSSVAHRSSAPLPPASASAESLVPSSTQSDQVPEPRSADGTPAAGNRTSTPCAALVPRSRTVGRDWPKRAAVAGASTVPTSLVASE